MKKLIMIPIWAISMVLFIPCAMFVCGLWAFDPILSKAKYWDLVKGCIKQSYEDFVL